MNKLIKKNIFCTSALTLMIATGVCSAAPLSGFIYAANKRDGSISEITLATELVRTFKASIVPHNVQITPDGDFLLSVGMTKTVFSINTISQQVTATFKVRAGPNGITYRRN